MKKILALLFVCASMTSFAQVSIVANDYVAFLYAYQYTDNAGHVTQADPYYAGGGVEWQMIDGQMCCAGLYRDAVGHTSYVPVNVNYNTGVVSLNWFNLLEDTSITGSGSNRVDTVRYSALVSEDYILHDQENAVTGTLANDGSIVFDKNKGYVYTGYQVLIWYRKGVEVARDTTYFETVYRGSEFLVANGKLEYVNESDNSVASCNVLIRQSNDTVYVGNMWNYGMPGAFMVLSSEGTLNYPCSEGGNMFNPIWDVKDTWVNEGEGMFYPIGSYTTDATGHVNGYTWGFDGIATPNELTWDYTMPSNGYYFPYGFLNNRLYYTDGSKFIVSPDDFLRGDVNKDGDVTIADVTTLIDHLLSGDLAEGDEFSVGGADTNIDGDISIADVTALIDYLLSGQWP